MIETTIEAGIGTVRLASPATANALTPAAFAELTAQILAVQRPDSGARVLVLTGSGKVFSAGANMDVLGGTDTTALAGAITAALLPLQQALQEGRLPTVAAVNGAAVGGAVGLALLGAQGRVSRNPIAYGISGFYTSFFRGTPLIVQLFLWYLALPQLALGLLPQQYATWFIWPAQVAGIVGIAFNYGAYMTEIFRSGIEAVPHGQAEAAAALGMSPGQQMRRIILPQATRIVIPATGNEFIAMMKDTALIGLLGTTLLWADPFRMAQLSGKADFRNLEALIAAALVYWGLTAVFSFFQRKLEERMSKGYVRQVKDAS